MWNEPNIFWNDLQQDTRSSYEILSDALTKAMDKQDIFEVIQLFRQGAPPHMNAVRLFDNRIFLMCLTYAGMNPNEIGGDLLIKAASFNRMDMVQDLLDYGVDINYRDPHVYDTALLKASFYQHKPMVEYLLQRGANLEMINQNHYTPLMYAISRPNNLSVIRYLLEQGANKYYHDENGFNLFTYCHQDYFHYFIQLGLDINEANHTGKTCLMQACVDQDIDKIYALLNLQEINIHQVDSRGWDALMFATNEEADNIVSILLSYGAKINHRRNDGRTALMHASYQGNFPLVEFLLRKKAKIDLKDENGDTALSHARYVGYDNVEKILLSHGATDFEALKQEKESLEEEEEEDWSTCSEDEGDEEDEEDEEGDWSTCSEDNEEDGDAEDNDESDDKPVEVQVTTEEELIEDLRTKAII